MDRLTIFYTYHLAGNLDMLPRLYSYLQTLKDDYGVARPLLLDLGRSCLPEVWHCEATEGRSTAVVLDGMGYHAINVTGILDTVQQNQLKRVLTSALIDERRSWRYEVPPVRDDGILISTAPSPALTLCIVANPATTTTLEGGILTLGYPDHTDGIHVGVVQVSLVDEAHITQTAMHALPASAKAHPTIITAVDFMLDEARHYQQRRS